MGLLDDAIREHLELRRTHGASEEEIARKETDALGPVRRETAASPSAGHEETWLSDEETMVIPSPAVEAAPGLPDEPLVPPPSPESDVEPEPFSGEPGPLVAEPESGATGWFDEAAGDLGREGPVEEGGATTSQPAGPGEPLAPADVFPESDPTVPDERLSADPPLVESGASVEETPVVHGEPLEERDSAVPLTDDEPPAAEGDRPIEDPTALVEEPPPAALLGPASERLSEEPLAREEDVPVEDVGAPLESRPPEEERLPADEPPLQEDELFEDEPPLQEDELFEDEPPALGVSELPLDPEESEWTLEERDDLEELGPAPSVPVGGGQAPVDERDDVLEDTPDFLQETPEHDRLWFEQRPPRDFDFDD
ncbi:MAG: hypothetical protein ACR2NV_07795 [Thermoleophilaceae bacterium]